MAEIDVATGKTNGSNTDLTYFPTLKGEPLKITTGSMRIPEDDAQKLAFYIMLNALKKLKSGADIGMIRIWSDLHRKEFSIGLHGWEFRAYFRLRVKTNDFVLIRTSFGGITEANLYTSIEYVENIQKCLKFVKKFVYSQSKMDGKKYPYIPKYNEKGWK